MEISQSRCAMQTTLLSRTSKLLQSTLLDEYVNVVRKRMGTVIKRQTPAVEDDVLAQHHCATRAS